MIDAWEKKSNVLWICFSQRGHRNRRENWSILNPSRSWLNNRKQEGMLLNAPNPTCRWGGGEQSRVISPSSYHHRQRIKAPLPPRCLWRTCADKMEGRLAAWAITATTSRLSMPRGARHYGPTCQVPTCLSMVSVAAHRCSNSQLVWEKKLFLEPTLSSNP